MSAPARGRKGRDLQAPAARASSAGHAVKAKAAEKRAASVGPAGSALPDWNELTPQSKLELYTALFQGTDGEHDFGSDGQAFAIYKAIPIAIYLDTGNGAGKQRYTSTVEKLLAHYLSGIRGATRKEGRFKLFAAQYIPTLGHRVDILPAFGALEITLNPDGRFKVQGIPVPYLNYAALPPGEYTTTRDVARRFLTEIAPRSEGPDGRFIMCDGCPDPPGSYSTTNPANNTINVLHTMATAADSSTGFSGYSTAIHKIDINYDFTMTRNILMSSEKLDIRFKLVGKPGDGNFEFVVMSGVTEANTVGSPICNARFPTGKSSGPSITYLANLASDDELLKMACDSTVSEPKFAAEYKKRTGTTLADSMWNFRGILQCLRSAQHWSYPQLKQLLFTEKSNGDSRPRLEREKLYQNPCKALVSIDELCSLNGASCNNGDDGLIEPLDYTSMYTHGENSVEIYKLPPRDPGAQARLMYDMCVFAVVVHNNLVDRINNSKEYCIRWGENRVTLQTKKDAYNAEAAVAEAAAEAAAEGGAAAGGAGGAGGGAAAAAADEAAAAAKNIALLKATVATLGADIFSECIENKLQFYDILCRRLTDEGITDFASINVGVFNPALVAEYTALKGRIDAQTKTMQEHRNIIDAIDGKNPVDEVESIKTLWNTALTNAVSKLADMYKFPRPEEGRNRNIIIDKRDKRKNFLNELFNALQDVVNKMKDTKTTKLMKLHVAALKNIITCKIDLNIKTNI